MDASAPPAKIIAEAADWLVKIQEHPLTENEQNQLQQWRAQSANHQRAWQAAQQLNQSFGHVPEKLGLSVLSRKQAQRRNLIKAISALLVIPTGSWLVYQHSSLLFWVADYHTATGEIREVILADGSKLILNTRSAVNVFFDENQRLIELLEGEIHITTASDTLARQLFVKTEHGQVHALGTEFTVRLSSEYSQVAVQQDAVEIHTITTNKVQRITAGQQSRFSKANIEPVAVSQPTTATAWTRQQLIIDNQPLADVIAELARYRKGWLRCDPAIGKLRLSGVFQLTDTDIALSNIAHTLPVSVVYRSAYWVTVTSNK
ncbi:FecR domain-containing protein [Methylophaga pinxianii]|uniref:FecR domain-containing protein n=1 Tax=Methylophaga pinxianii TaxID=2881052 RepID=UPI001CF3E1A7|nr:FecR domain-containing protein [Methylophaga pinxianii]MCB2428059.1 FecR domain-containing protein [Methylophaga pinxianii]UPH46065.1 FecR domain-containing protein [Methylophaga pinxianii]